MAIVDRAVLRSSLRNWPSPAWYRATGPERWLQILWTFLFNTAISAVLTLFSALFSRRPDLAATAWGNFVVAQCIGFAIYLLFRLGLVVLGSERIHRFTAPQRAVFYGGIPLLGVLAGWPIGLLLLGAELDKIVEQTPRVFGQVLFFSVLLSSFWYRYMANKSRLAQAEAERERERARALAADKQLLDAELRALQAQIEPHFLFNTLANVASLIDSAPDKARSMLARLIDLLRASLAASRAAKVDVGRELDLVRAYLEILAIRMGARLRYTIDAPDTVRGRPIPPLLVQPLVENAIKHGLEPKMEGGSVVIRVREGDGVLQVEVEDDGLGFAPSAASGVGLANLRERLAALYDGRARLTIESLAPGTRVKIAVPLDPPGAA